AGFEHKGTPNTFRYVWKYVMDNAVSDPQHSDNVMRILVAGLQTEFKWSVLQGILLELKANLL
ncbi:hypothetical protein FOCC_FOCC016864, partial [Frankliniella occidentalis]